MSKWIDADALMAHEFKNDISYKAFCNLVKRQPAADVAPVRHGRWEPYDDSRWRCSECGFFIEVDIIDEITVTERSYPKFCLNCGARMDQGDNDEQMC
ncbi:MAG: hypothetical protein IJ680_06665 [Paludibacteraceae bacterium]|nr:hypothetical protein [Paludibacteraceae bacterium]